MIHKFFRKHKKKAVISTAILSLLVLSVCVVCIYNSRILAGVFQSHKNEDGTVSYAEKNTIEILEIVAQNGQQVLGYTVEGYEPITTEQIESYTGDIDHDEFLRATGYDVTGTPGNYTVNSSHNITFNENVLNGAMYSENDKIIVNVVTASALTEDDLESADLIYINSADNDDNLLYYYDQIVNNGKDGILKGDKGQTFAGSLTTDISVKEMSLSKILKAAGRPTSAETLTIEDFEKAGAENIKDYNLAAYISGIGALEKDSLEGKNIGESVEKISAALDTINKKAKEDAIKVIRNYVDAGTIADEDRENFLIALKQREYANYAEVNAQAYIDQIISLKYRTDKKIENAIKSVNNTKNREALKLLISIKSGTFVREELTDEEYLAVVAQGIAEVFYNSEEYNTLNAQFYADLFLTGEFTYTLADNAAFKAELTDNVILIVNEEQKDNALTILAASASNRTDTDNLKGDLDEADRLFSLAELENYKRYNLERYLDAIGDLEDPQALMTQQPVGEDGKYIWQYSAEKIENLIINPVNDSKQPVDNSCDISWRMAMKLYEYVVLNNRALVYNTELLTSGTIGDYTVSDGANNTNSMYKLLLVLRQMRPDYFRNTVLPKIDADGNYDDGTGTLNASWYAGTFCSTWNNEAATDKNNFCEPAVVGNVYDKEGNILASTNYVKDNILSYTGNQFFGGQLFHVDTDNYNEPLLYTIIGLEKKETGKKIYIDYSKVASWWDAQAKAGNQYIYCYLDDGTEKQIKVGDVYPDRAYTYGVEIPLNTVRCYFYLGNSTWGDYNRSEDINVAGYSSGTLLVLSDSSYTSGSIKYQGKTQTVRYRRTASLTDKKITDTGGDEEDSKTKGDVLRQIMGISLNQLQSMPFKVLEIQPTGAVNEFDSYAGAERLADYLRVDLPEMNSTNYTDYFQIESISIREFNTRHEELNGKYDLIYFGVETGYMASKKFTSADGKETITRAVYGNSTVMNENYYMNGLVYTGIGPQRTVGASLRGTVATDYYVETSPTHGGYKSDHALWTKYFFAEFSEPGNNNYLDPNTYYAQTGGNNYIKTRMTGNDLTVARMNDLLDYVKAGYPILFADGLLNSDEEYENATVTTASAKYDNAVKWKYLDNHSKLYAFIQQAKALGRDTAGEYTDSSAFNDGKTYASLVSVKYAKYGKNPDKLVASEKFNGGLSFAAKRNIQVDFKYISGPQEYDRDADGNTLAVGEVGNYITDMNSCSFILQPNVSRENVMEWINDNYTFHFYIDKSGTANFPEKQTVELDLVVDYNEKANQITVSTRKAKWPTGLEGFIPWKLEAVSKYNEGNKWTYVGYSAFEKKEPDVVNVLWVKTNNLNLDFSAMIDKYDGHSGGTDYIPEYDIRVDTITYSNFVNNWNGISQEEKDNPYNKSRSRLKVGKIKNIANKKTAAYAEGSEPEYDMIVFGYCDSYRGLDISNIYCLNNIDYFVNRAKHSMLFAHDNASYVTSFNYYTNGRTGSTSMSTGSHSYTTDFARYTTSFMRGMLGMDAYGSSYSPLAFDPANVTTDRDYLSWLYKYTPSVYNARSYIATSQQNPSTTELSDMRGYVDGQLLWYSASNSSAINDNEVWPFKSNETTNIGQNSYSENWLTTNGIECTNKGQIAVYPFVIGDELTIDSKTHFQYTRLDVENDDTTVWYTLSNSGGRPYYDVTKGDGSNNYYIYSNGNITYTGAGHTKIDKDAKECKLFINTVVAAIKLGNFAPDVTFPDAVAVNNSEVLYGYDTDKTLKVAFKATDYDVPSGITDNFLDAVIFLDKNKDGRYDAAAGDILLNTPQSIGGAVNYLKDENGNPMVISGPELVNRETMTFYLNYDDLAAIYDSVHGYSTKTTSEKVKALFEKETAASDDYQISISVLSKSENDKFIAEGDASLTIQDYYQSGNARVILRTLYNLK